MGFRVGPRKKKLHRIYFIQGDGSKNQYNFHTMLPILHYRNQIRTLLHSHKKLIVTAPPGTGKSTQVPQFFIDELTPQKQIVVLQPRRIAARTLASRVAEELGGACGEKVGYQVRFERKVSPDTVICFQTYGTFLQQLLVDPCASNVSILVFDEFHERTLEADLLLAWARMLAAGARPDLRIMVLSATLESGPLKTFLEGSAVVDVAEHSYPVSLLYQQPKPREPLAEQVDRSFNGLFPMKETGSVLVFLPGVYEIERAGEKVFESCRRRGFRLMMLHGKMRAAEQLDVLRMPAKEPCVILATNVAETSLTIPGVVAVIDSGLARVAAYDPERDRNTLYVSRISIQNATQRAGRAGRLTEGVCVRLWTKVDERVMPETIGPEMLRLDLARSVLSLFQLGTSLAKQYGGCKPGGRPQDPSGSTFTWLTPPAQERWNAALETLLRCGAIEVPQAQGLIPLTKLGERMARLPVEPAIAALLLASEMPPVRRVNIAMASVWENGAQVFTESKDLFDLAGELTLDKARKEFGRECHETRDQLERIVGIGRHPAPEKETGGGPLRDTVSKLWMRTFGHRIASKTLDGSLYMLGDGRTARLVLKKKPGQNEIVYPQLIVALTVHERGGRALDGHAQARQVSVPLYLPLDTAWLEEAFPNELKQETACRWDDVRKRVIVEKKVMFRSLVCKAEEIDRHRKYQSLVTACLAEKLADGAWDWKRHDPHAEQFVYKMKLAAEKYPEMVLPLMNSDDWELVRHELCEGKTSLAEVEKASVLQALKLYIGEMAARFIEKKAPDTIHLPSGKKARVTYFEGAPPEISARLGDLIGHKERFMLMDGRVEGIFNILAPNYRTVQKTADLGSFWKNTYPAIKSELKRKYPKHPWP